MNSLEHLVTIPTIRDGGYYDLSSEAITVFISQRSIFRAAMGKVDGFKETEGVVFHSLCSFLTRIEEQAEGMFASFVTGCTGASETVGRTVVETSVNLMYLLNGDKGRRLVSFFRHYLQEHRKKLKTWEDWTREHHPSESFVFACISDRRSGIEAYAQFTEQLALELDMDDGVSVAGWKDNILERFKDTGHISGYWTVYHRLSASTHGSPEDTLRSLIGMLSFLEHGDQSLSKGVTNENISYSAMMLCLVVQFYIEVGTMLCRSYNRLEVINVSQTAKQRLDRRIEELSGAAGCLQHE